MGFQQELFEVDLERGENGAGDKAVGGAFRAETTITYALILLIVAAVIRPTEAAGWVLAVCSFGLSVGGAYTLARRIPPAPHAKKVLIILATCWLLYGVRIVHLTSDVSGQVSIKKMIPKGVPRKLGSPPIPPNAVGHEKKVGPVQRLAIHPGFDASHVARKAGEHEMAVDDGGAFGKV